MCGGKERGSVKKEAGWCTDEAIPTYSLEPNAQATTHTSTSQSSEKHPILPCSKPVARSVVLIYIFSSDLPFRAALHCTHSHILVLACQQIQRSRDIRSLRNHTMTRKRSLCVRPRPACPKISPPLPSFSPLLD